MDRPVLIFATRGSIQDGLGHVMRSRAVAEDLAMQGVALKMLILGDESSLALLRHTALDYEYCSSDEELSVRILELHAVCVVFDMLRFDQGCLERIKEQCLTISLSPVFSGLAEMEHMFHRTVHEDPSWADKVRFPKIHKGLQYAIISERCHRISNAVFREHLGRSPLSVAISMGGADAPNRTLSVLRVLKEASCSLLIWVALGEAYTHSYEDLVEAVRGTKHEVILVKSNESMWRVLQSSCVLICSSGITPYEAAYVGLPSIILPERTGGEYLVRELEENGACRILPPGKLGLEMLKSLLEEWEGNRELIQQSHNAATSLIGTSGTQRVACMIRELLESRT